MRKARQYFLKTELCSCFSQETAVLNGNRCDFAPCIVLRLSCFDFLHKLFARSTICECHPKVSSCVLFYVTSRPSFRPVPSRGLRNSTCLGGAFAETTLFPPTHCEYNGPDPIRVWFIYGTLPRLNSIWE